MFVTMSVFVLASMLLTACGSAAPAPAPEAAAPAEAALVHKGVNLKVLANTGPFIIKPVYDHAPEFEASTGAKVTASEI